MGMLHSPPNNITHRRASKRVNMGIRATGPFNPFWNSQQQSSPQPASGSSLQVPHDDGDGTATGGTEAGLLEVGRGGAGHQHSPTVGAEATGHVSTVFNAQQQQAQQHDGEVETRSTQDGATDDDEEDDQRQGPQQEAREEEEEEGPPSCQQEEMRRPQATTTSSLLPMLSIRSVIEVLRKKSKPITLFKQLLRAAGVPLGVKDDTYRAVRTEMDAANFPGNWWERRRHHQGGDKKGATTACHLESNLAVAVPPSTNDDPAASKGGTYDGGGGQPGTSSCPPTTRTQVQRKKSAEGRKEKKKNAATTTKGSKEKKKKSFNNNAFHQQPSRLDRKMQQQQVVGMPTQRRQRVVTCPNYEDRNRFEVFITNDSFRGRGAKPCIPTTTAAATIAPAAASNLRDVDDDITIPRQHRSRRRRSPPPPVAGRTQPKGGDSDDNTRQRLADVEEILQSLAAILLNTHRGPATGGGQTPHQHRKRRGD